MLVITSSPIIENFQNDAIDVLDDHRKCNYAMHPPNIPADEDPIQYDDVENSVKEHDETEDELSSQRARRYSKTPRDADPKSTTMKYYPPSWQAVLELAKNNMRKHIALVNAFPRRDRDLKEATLILKNTITEYERIEGNNVLEPGSLFISLNLLVIDHLF